MLSPAAHAGGPTMLVGADEDVVKQSTVTATKAKLGADPSKWQLPATCPTSGPTTCDQEVPNTAGAVATPPFPWQDRGTYHQVDELTGHR